MEFRPREIKKPMHPLNPKHPDYKKNLEQHNKHKEHMAKQTGTKEFRKRDVKLPNKVTQKNSFAPDFGGLQEKLRTEISAAKGYSELGVPPIPQPTEDVMAGRNVDRGQKVFIVSFNCEMFELGEFNQTDVLCPIKAIDKEYKMETGTRLYTYSISQDDAGTTIKTLVDFWRPHLSNRKYKFSIANRIDNSMIGDVS